MALICSCFSLGFLLRKLLVPRYVFGDELKIVPEVNDNNQKLNQFAAVNIEECSIENKILPSIEKCCVLYGGRNNPG